MGYAQGFTRLWPSVGVYVSFLIGVTLQTMATNGSSVGLTYIIILGMEACLSVLGGVLLFSESYSTLKLAGIALVTIGIAFLRH